MPDRNQSARWPTAAPREAQVPCSNLSGTPKLEVSAASSSSAGGGTIVPSPDVRESSCWGHFSAGG